MPTKIFISYASENKHVAEKFARALCNKGFDVWYDDFVIKIGHHITKSIEEGLREADYGLLILSKEFFEKYWPQLELTSLLALQKRIIPLWYKIDKKYVEEKSPLLIDIKSIPINDDEESFKKALEEILKVTQPQDRDSRNLLEMLTIIKESGVSDPNVDLFIGVLKNRADLVEKAIEMGANINVTDVQIVNYHQGILKKKCPGLLCEFLINIEKRKKAK